MSGGSGRLGGTLIGALIIGILDNGLNLMGVNSDWQYIIKGVVILGAVYMDFLRSRKRARASPLCDVPRRSSPGAGRVLHSAISSKERTKP